MFHASAHYHHPMDTLVHALVLSQLATKSVTTVTVKPTTWLEFGVELVKEMAPGQEVTHLVFMVICSRYWLLDLTK